MQNMFLAIIGETYAVVKEDIQSKTADFTIQDFFKTGVNNTKGYLGILDRYITGFFWTIFRQINVGYIVDLPEI